MRISDWSSDVCSSDLGRVEAGGLRTVCRVHVSKSEPADLRAAKWKARREAGPSFSAIPPPAYETRAPIALISVNSSMPSRPHRSEERRVGEECVSTCRSRWSPYRYKKTNEEHRKETRLQ